MRTGRRVMRVEATTYLWVRWLVDGTHSSWHQVREDSVPRPFEGDLLQVLRLWTRCGFEVPDPQKLEIWSGPLMPLGQMCIHCTRSYFVETMPPLGTPPIAGGRRRTFRIVDPPRRRGSAPAAAGSLEQLDLR